MLNDQEIAKKADIHPIEEIVSKLGIEAEDLEKYGKYKARICYEWLNKKEGKKGK